MRTYRELFRTPEFAPLFGASCAQVAATTLAGLALATLVYARTDSPLLSALSTPVTRLAVSESCELEHVAMSPAPTMWPSTGSPRTTNASTSTGLLLVVVTVRVCVVTVGQVWRKATRRLDVLERTRLTGVTVPSSATDAWPRSGPNLAIQAT